MPWFGFVLTLCWNYAIHRRRKRVCPDNCRHWRHCTVCSATRRLLPWWAVVVGWCGLSGWLLPHIRNGYGRDR